MQTRNLNGATVRVVRELTGISQRDLAARCDITQGALSNIERGIHGTSPETNRKLAEAMGVPLESITYPVGIAEPEPVAQAAS
jgi:transcriptional regulator with XRE-family HTH domain